MSEGQSEGPKYTPEKVGVAFTEAFMDAVRSANKRPGTASQGKPELNGLELHREYVKAFPNRALHEEGKTALTEFYLSTASRRAGAGLADKYGLMISLVEGNELTREQWNGFRTRHNAEHADKQLSDIDFSDPEVIESMRGQVAELLAAEVGMMTIGKRPGF